MIDKTDLTRLILHEKPVDIILCLAQEKETYASQIAKKIDCTYPYTLKILADLEQNKLVEFNREGRIKEVKLTEKGVEVAHDLLGLARHLGRIDAAEKKREPREEQEPAE